LTCGRRRLGADGPAGPSSRGEQVTEADINKCHRVLFDYADTPATKIIAELEPRALWEQVPIQERMRAALMRGY
jgi:hypothetical protein